jgi:large subunit ribosomal protein L21
MGYAIIKTGGKQYKASKDSILEVERLNFKPGEKFQLEDVLLYVDGDKIKIGKPKVSGIKVSATVLEHFKGEKLRISKFKAKAKYRRSTGHRQSSTRIKILDILTAVKN